MKYEDIIHLSRPISTKHPPMSLYDRAAQFSPFAALTGHEAAIEETARLTDARMELDEDEKENINQMLQEIAVHLKEEKEVAITYFLPDERKVGGSYPTITGVVKNIHAYERVIIMKDGSFIPIDQIKEIIWV
jgi:hypothetical protein